MVLTTVFVTHDQGEALEVADRVALLIGGRLEGHGPPEEVYRRPSSLRAARFLGVGNEVAGTVRSGEFRGRGGVWARAAVSDGPAVLVVRAEDLRMMSPNDEGEGLIEATVVAARFSGAHQSVTVRTPDAVELTVHTRADAPVTLGERVRVRLPDRPLVFSAA